MDQESQLVVRCFLEYFYTHDYKYFLVELVCALHSYESAEMHVEIYAIAERLDLPELKDVAARKFHAVYKSMLKEFLPRQFSEWSFQKIVDIIEAVYTTTPRRVSAFNGLREQIVCLFQRDKHRREFLENIDFTQIADGNPEIWKDFVIGTLGLGDCKWGPRLELVGRRRMSAVLQDVPRNRQEPTRLALQTSRRSDSFKDLRRCKDRLQALSETPAYWKNWARALTGLQRGDLRWNVLLGPSCQSFSNDTLAV